MTDRSPLWRALPGSRLEKMAKRRTKAGAGKKGVEKEDGRVERVETLLRGGECLVAQRV
jgi:hypothetical protein